MAPGSGASAPDPELTHWDVGVAAALRRRTDGGGDLLAHPSPTVGVVHLFGCDLTHVVRDRLAVPEDAMRPTRFPGWRLEHASTGSTRVPAGLGLISPVASPGLLVQVAAGVAYATGRVGPGRVTVSVSPVGVVAAGSWHEAIAFASAARAPLVAVTGPSGESSGDGLGFDMRRASLAHGALYEEAYDDAPSAYAATRRAVDRARSRPGLQLVRITRSTSSPADELGALRALGVSQGLASADELSTMDDESGAIARRAVESALEAA